MTCSIRPARLRRIRARGLAGLDNCCRYHPGPDHSLSSRGPDPDDFWLQTGAGAFGIGLARPKLMRIPGGQPPVYFPQNTATTAVFSRAAIAPALSGADVSGESSTAPRKAFSASGPTIGCGAAMTTPAMR